MIVALTINIISRAAVAVVSASAPCFGLHCHLMRKYTPLTDDLYDYMIHQRSNTHDPGV